MRALEIRLLESVTDVTLKKINEGRLSFVHRGTGVCKVTFATSAPVIISLLNKRGLILTNASDTTGVTSKTVSGNVAIYLKLTASDYLCFDRADYLTEFGSSSTELVDTTTSAPQINSDMSDLSDFINLTRINCNSPLLRGDIANIGTISNLGVLNMNSATQIFGNISVFSSLSQLVSIGLSNTRVSGDLSVFESRASLNSLNIANSLITGLFLSLKNTSVSYLNIVGCNLSGDISNLPNTIVTLSAYGITAGITYTGGQAVKFPTIDRFFVSDAPLASGQLDNLIISLSNSAWIGNKSMTLKGVRSSASDAAITTLQGKGVTVTINL